ncbi:MAG: family 16 glycosylhydrolase [Rhodobacteraceae bacterium]|nr:family 16 glycosylhydrolase [Paracoccaceae bacterium]
MRTAAAQALAVALAVLAVPPAARAVTAGAAFFEPFDRLDPARWYVSDGWTNGDHQNCLWSRKAVQIADGVLTLALIPGTGDGADAAAAGHLCGEVQTDRRYGHGTYEARIRTSDVSGLNAAFFTYIGPVHDKPHDEIDVEILTKAPGTVELNTFIGGKMLNGAKVPLDPAADEGFRVYAFEWSPEGIRWFVDGREVHAAEGPLPANPMKIYLSHWSTGTLTDWMGPFAVPEGPVAMEVDWVAFTPLGADCHFPESLLCR